MASQSPILKEIYEKGRKRKMADPKMPPPFMRGNSAPKGKSNPMAEAKKKAAADKLAKLKGAGK